MPEPIRLVALISGGGTTLQNLLDQIAAGKLPATVAGVVSSRADAFGITRAEKAGVPVKVVEKRTGGSRPPLAKWDDEVWDAVRAFTPQLVCFAGWLRLLPIP